MTRVLDPRPLVLATLVYRNVARSAIDVPSVESSNVHVWNRCDR